MCLYFGLSIDAGTACVAAAGSVRGGLWAQLAESSQENERLLSRIKTTILALLIAPLFAMCLMLSVQGLLNGEVHAFS